jgi:Ca2+-binding RTX toxin-like protein
VATVNWEALFGWDNFRGFTFQAGSVEFRASDESEVVNAVQEFEFGPDIASLDMGGGNDQVVLYGLLVPVDGGPGSDWVRALGFADERSRTPERRVAVDLMRDTIVVNNFRPGTTINDIENVEVDGFGTAVLRGDSQGNELLVRQTCLARLYGLGGPDTLGGRPPSRCGANKAEFFGVPRSIVAYGNGGNDLMTGRATQDRLLGGPGADTADGRDGVDACKAETEYRCER